MNEARVEHVRDGVLLVHAMVALADQPGMYATLLGDALPDVLAMPVTQLVTERAKHKSTELSPRMLAVRALSEQCMALVYGPGGVWSALPEDGCTEDHLGRPCFCGAHASPHLPRSTVLNCLDGLAYKPNTQKGWHRDFNWLVALTFGDTVRMGFRLHDDDPALELLVPSGSACVFNGALHMHAVLGIVPDTAPPWWRALPEPRYSRAVFLMRDSRQSYRAQQRKARRVAAAAAGAREAAARATAGAVAAEGVVVPEWLRRWLLSDASPRALPERAPTRHHRHVVLVQAMQMQSVAEAAAVVDAIARAYRPHMILFSEDAFAPTLRNGNTAHLAPLLEQTVALDVAVLLGTCPETDGPSVYVTSMVLEAGVVACKYRKRKAVTTGAHAEGTEAVLFRSHALGDAATSIMICFDVENADVRDETLALRPKVLLNPTRIPAPNAAMRKYEQVFVASWRSALESMRAKFQRLCGLVRGRGEGPRSVLNTDASRWQHNVWLARADCADPSAGTSQLIGPYSTISAPHFGCALVHGFIDEDDSNHFGSLTCAPTQERTKLEDNTGSTYDTRLFVPPVSASGPRVALVARAVKNSVVAVFSDMCCVANARDGHMLSSTGPLPFAVRGAAVSSDGALCLLGVGDSLCVMNADAAWKQAARIAVTREAGFVSALDGGLAVVDRQVVDLRVARTVASLSLAAHVSTRAVLRDPNTLFVGTTSGAASFDLRQLGASPVELWGRGQHVVAVDSAGYWAVGSTVCKASELQPVYAYHAPVTALAWPLAGLADGSVVGGRHRFGTGHRRAVSWLDVADDYSFVSVSASYDGVAVTSLRQNEQRQTPLNDLFRYKDCSHDGRRVH